MYMWHTNLKNIVSKRILDFFFKKKKTFFNKCVCLFAVNEVTAHTHDAPLAWQGRAHDVAVRDEFSQRYQLRLLLGTVCCNFHHNPKLTVFYSVA